MTLPAAERRDALRFSVLGWPKIPVEAWLMKLMNRRSLHRLLRLTLAALPALGQMPGMPESQHRTWRHRPSANLPALTETYKHLHRNPELSHHEEKTSALLAAELRKLGYTVTEHVGKYQDGSQAYGVVAVLENGAGPRLLIRTDMDALPVEEKTGLDYASTVRSTNAQGQDVGVMHACGHDLHMTVLLGVAREMVAAQEPVARHADADWAAFRGDDRRRASDAGRRSV